MMNKEVFRNNCFTLIRYILAFSVVFLHMNKFFETNFMGIFSKITSVPLFFFISALLLSYSLDNKKQTLNEYMYARFKRLIPEMWMAVALSVVLLVVQFPRLITQTQFYVWLVGQVSIFQFYTPGILRFYGVGTPNGSLWTISVFFQFYLLVFFLFPIIKKLSYKKDLLIVIVGVLTNCCLGMLESILPDVISKLLWQTMLPYIYMFYLGMMFYKYFDKIVNFCRKYYWLITCTYLFEYINSSMFNIIPHTSNTSAPIHVIISCIFFFATAYKFTNIKIKNDYSYGIYVFNMVFVNLFIHNGFVINKTITYLLVIVLTVLSAVISNKISKKLFG